MYSEQPTREAAGMYDAEQHTYTGRIEAGRIVDGRIEDGWIEDVQLSPEPKS